MAKAAGVSSITVSRVLRNPDKVSPNLRETILALIENMGYVPDFAARALATRDSGLIGVLVPSMSNYVFTGVMRGIEDCVRRTGLRIHYANSHMDPEEEARQLKLFLGQMPAGIIIAGVEDTESSRELLRKSGCPVVQVMDVTLPPMDLAVGINLEKASAAATRHLLDCGYRRIALLGTDRSIRSARRLLGYQKVLEQDGSFDPRHNLVAEGQTGVPGGAELMRQVLDEWPSIDAVLCQNDDLALGALFECQRRGVRVPEDIGICGFNDLEFAAYTVPALTSVRTPQYEIGFKAVELLLQAASGVRAGPSVIDVGFELIERGSTRKRQAS